MCSIRTAEEDVYRMSRLSSGAVCEGEVSEMEGRGSRRLKIDIDDRGRRVWAGVSAVSECGIGDGKVACF